MIKTLSLTFKKKGVYYSQIKREGDIAILSLRYTENGRIVGYDVVRVKKYSTDGLPSFINNPPSDYTAIEAIVPSSAWGSEAWSFDLLPSAEKKFQELLNVCKS